MNNNPIQIEMFGTIECHYCEIKRFNRKIKGWVVPYHKDSEWSGAWYKKQEGAWKFAEYIRSKHD